jgi:hypothetical protein
MTIYELYFEWNSGKRILLLPECTERESLIAITDTEIKYKIMTLLGLGHFTIEEVKSYVV